MDTHANVVQFPKKQLAALNAVDLSIVNMGDRGPNVSKLQVALATWGFDPNGVDGIYGPNTQAAVKQLQAALHVDQTGNFDAPTLEAVSTDLAMPRGVLPRQTFGPGPTNDAPAQIDQKPLPTWLWALLGLSGVAFLYMIFKGSEAPSAPMAPQAPGVSGASDYLDLPDHPDEPAFESDNRGYEGEEDPVDAIAQEQFQRRHARKQGRYLMQKRRERDALRRKAAGFGGEDEEDAEIVEE